MYSNSKCSSSYIDYRKACLSESRHSLFSCWSQTAPFLKAQIRKKPDIQRTTITSSMLHKTRNSEHTTKGHHNWNVLPTILILRFVPIWTCPLILGTTLIFTFYDATSNDPLTLEHLSEKPNAMRDAWWNPPIILTTNKSSLGTA